MNIISGIDKKGFNDNLSNVLLGGLAGFAGGEIFRALGVYSLPHEVAHHLAQKSIGATQAAKIELYGLEGILGLTLRIKALDLTLEFLKPNGRFLGLHSCSIGKPNYLGKMLGPNLSNAWVLSAGPLVDAVLFNALFAASTKNWLKSNDENLGLKTATLAFSINLLFHHLRAYGPQPGYDIIAFWKHYNANVDIEKMALELRFQFLKFHELKFTKIIRTSIGILPLLAFCIIKSKEKDMYCEIAKNKQENFSKNSICYTREKFQSNENSS